MTEDGELLEVAGRVVGDLCRQSSFDAEARRHDELNERRAAQLAEIARRQEGRPP
jgi:hypothetical protein